MRDAISKQIAQTLANMTAEVRDNGLTEAASDMWLHALSMHRKYKLHEDPGHQPAFDDSQLSILLRPQAS